MKLKKKRQRTRKRLIKNEEKTLIKRVKYEYKKGGPSYKLTIYNINYLSITQADKVIREYLDKEEIKFEAKTNIDMIDSISFNFIDEEE